MTIRVLLVDDHKIVREGTRQLLEKSPDLEIVGEAADGAEAVQLACNLRPDVIVMDVRLPVLNGIDATRAIKAKLVDVRILILSAYADDRYVYPLLEAGASGYLLKTSSGSELISAIHTVHSGGTALSSNIAGKVVNRVAGHPTYRGAEQIESLTEREMEVLHAVALGKANKTIAEALSISPQTVQVHLRNIYMKLGVNSRSEASAVAYARGWVIPDFDHE